MSTIHVVGTHPHHHHEELPLNEKVSVKVIELARETLSLLQNQRDRLTGRAFIRAALAALGEGVKETRGHEELHAVGNAQDEDDYIECLTSVEGMVKKMKEAASEKERDSVVTYLKSIYRMLGSNTASGGLTPRPRDYAAAMSRLGEGALNSPSQLRGPSVQERLEHTHSTTRL